MKTEEWRERIERRETEAKNRKRKQRARGEKCNAKVHGKDGEGGGKVRGSETRCAVVNARGKCKRENRVVKNRESTN